MTYTLETVRKVYEALGELRAPAVHIAGSKGKGTTATLLAKILELSGERVGLFTSPAFLKDEDMISVNGVDIPSDTLERLKEKILAVDDSLSTFEALTLVALQYFNEENCTLVVLECGLGGLYDSTNVVENKALTLLTHIELEHTDILGHTLQEITYNKLGICRPGVPLITVASQAPDVFKEIQRQGLSPLFAPAFALGQHHPESGGLAVMAAELLGYSLDSVMEEKLRHVQLHGRFEVLKYGIHTLVLEGAHTYDSLTYFLERLRLFVVEQSLPEPLFAVHILKDKPRELLELFPRARTFWLPLDDPRASDKPDFLLEKTPLEWKAKLDASPDPHFLVVTGSFKPLAFFYKVGIMP